MSWLKHSTALVLYTVLAQPLMADTDALLKSQTAYSIETEKLQQQEWLLDINNTQSLLGGDLNMIGQIRLDTADDLNRQDSRRPSTYSALSGPMLSDKHGEVDLREFYWQRSGDRVYWRLGKQQVVWGEADGLKVLDVINPQSYREFNLDDFDDSRIPLWMVNAEVSLTDDTNLQILWVPDTSAHELAPQSSPFVFTSPLLVPDASSVPQGINLQLQQAEAPELSLDNSDYGLRLNQFSGGWDLSLSYLYHYVDTPVVRAELSGNILSIQQDYKRSHLFGATASTAMGEWILRSEFAYETDRYHRTQGTLPGVVKSDVISSVIGLDWQGWSDQFVSLQWFHSSRLENTADMISKSDEDSVSLLWESKFLNETLSAKWLQVESLSHEDRQSQLKLTYNLESNMDLYMGADLFHGDKAQLFGQFDQADRVLAGFNLGF